MSYSTLLINTCTVKRHTVTGTDAYGQPVYNWADHLVDEPCRWSIPKNKENREIKIGAEVVIVDLQLFLGDVDITEQDRVVLDGETYEVISSVKRQDGTGEHHVEAFLKRVE